MHGATQVRIRQSGRTEAAFNPVSGWNVIAMESEGVLTNFHEHGAAAWLAIIKRIQTVEPWNAIRCGGLARV